VAEPDAPSGRSDRLAGSPPRSYFDPRLTYDWLAEARVLPWPAQAGGNAGEPVRRQVVTMAYRRDRLNPSQGASI
jgi:hypothetical protein